MLTMDQYYYMINGLRELRGLHTKPNGNSNNPGMFG